MLGWRKHKLESRLPGEISITSDMQMTSPFGRKQRTRASWWKRRVKKLKLNIQKPKIIGSGPITSWQIYGETMETVRDLILGGSKITADCDRSHEIKRRLLLGRKAMTNLVQFSCSVMSDSLRPHGLQHARLPGSSPASGTCWNSWPSSWWCYPTSHPLLSPSPAFSLSQA